MILIVGATCEIGQATVERLVNNGMAVLEVSRKSYDVLTEVGLKALIADIERSPSSLNGVVQFIGGQSGDGAISELSDKDWINTFTSNVLTTVRLARALETLIQPGSCWINISSTMARTPSEFNSHYSASKAALESFSRSMALAWAKKSIRVSTLRLGSIDTKKNRVSKNFDEKRILSRVALGRMGTKEEVASMIEFILSEDAKWITGHVIDLDGGTGLR